ncbi:hypothetical protein NA57DRAFT_39696 [Rhizodiscina lignyota]|uniref:Uncharacterized protein n=1 Tax=Rhizodiscina lignyota TaxID=1504668 RepID=A0A9P4IG50_9PEZI|nr:hypothetical protein NA57DRAFT_39696 [Rhizodiscina lignyota]
MGHNALPMDAPAAMPPSLQSKSLEPTPDLLTRAFNEALRPHQEKLDQLEADNQDMRAYIESLEQERAELHNWIDKRGLRPDVPPSIAKSMDAPNPNAAQSLSNQLDRKITIVNFDLHRLQDDLNDSISTRHFADSMLKFLPDLSRLSALPTGPKYAFDLLLKLGGNLNSHGGLDSQDEEDKLVRKDFFDRVDNLMVDIVSRRFEEGEEWPVQREIRRLEKTATYLRNFGVESYFPRALDLMKSESGGAGYGSDGQHSGSAGVNGVGGGVPNENPPKY